VGRLLAEHGHRVAGLDASPTLVAPASQSAGTRSASEGDHAAWGRRRETTFDTPSPPMETP